MGHNNLRRLLPDLSKRVGVTNKYTGHHIHTFVNRATPARISTSDTVPGRKRLQSLDPYIHDDATTNCAKAARFQDSMSVRSQPQAVISSSSSASSSQDSTSARSQSQAAISYNNNALSPQTGAPGPLALHQPPSAPQPAFHAVENVDCIGAQFSHRQPNNAACSVQQPHFAVASTVHVPDLLCQGLPQPSINQVMRSAPVSAPLAAMQAEMAHNTARLQVMRQLTQPGGLGSVAAFGEQLRATAPSANMAVPGPSSQPSFQQEQQLTTAQALNSGFSSILQHFRGNPQQ